MSAAASHPVDLSRAAAVEEFGRSAPPAETMIYFSGGWLVQSDPAVRAARRLIDLGVAIPTQKRVAPGLFDYYLTKRRNAEGKPLSRGQVEAGRASFTGAGEVAEECDRLMAVLRRLATRAEACPSDATLAERALLKDKRAARYRLQLLQSQGLIDLSSLADGSRVVTIVASGRSTARPALRDASSSSSAAPQGDRRVVR